MHKIAEIKKNYDMGLLTQDEYKGQALNAIVANLSPTDFLKALGQLEFDLFDKIIESICGIANNELKLTFYGKEYRCKLSFSKYQQNKRTCISIIDCSDGSPLTKATVNLPEYDIKDDEVAIKDHSENEGLLRQLITNGIVSEPIHYIRSGHVEIPICKLLVNHKS